MPAVDPALEVVALTQALIRCPSVTPDSAGVMALLESTLVALGFTVYRQIFHEEGTAPVENLYARVGNTAPNFCFAGHTDVVPVGEASAWTYPAFAAEIHDGMLYGRGAEDMKGAIAAFIAACARFLRDGMPTHGSISLLITQDEEGIAINGTQKMLAWLKNRGETITACIVGEPTNPDALGDMIKIGRRGSISFTLTIKGKQGHVAYPERARNPITLLLDILHTLKSHRMDEGTPHFPPSNLEITTIDVANPTVNVIPQSAQAKFNIRFNTCHSRETIEQWIHQVCSRYAGEHYHLETRFTGDAFVTENAVLTEMLSSTIEEITGKHPQLSTTGGTSDARFIKDFCPVIEFGTTGNTPHMVNECVSIEVLSQLSTIYEAFLRRYFQAR